MLAYGAGPVPRASTWSPARARSTPSPPSGCSRASSASTPRPARPRSRSWPTTPPTPAFVAADLISQAEHDPMAAAVLVTDSRRLADDVEAELDKQVRRDQAHRADPHRAGRPAVRRRAGRRPRAGPRRGQRLRRRAPRDPDRRRGRVAARVRNAGAIFVGGYAPVSLGDYCAGLQPRAAHRRLRLPLLGALGARVPARGARRRLLPRRRWRRSPATSWPWPRPRTCPGHGAAVAVRFEPRTDDAGRPPLRDGAARASSRTARPSSTSRCSSTSTRTPTRPSPACVADIRDAVAAAAGSLNRYPDREFTDAARRAGGVPRAARPASGSTPGAGVGGQRLQRGDAAAAAGLRRSGAHGGVVRADVLDVPRVRPRHRSPPGWPAVATRTSPSTSTHARDLIAEHRPERRAAALAEQPDRHRAAARGGRRRCASCCGETSRRGPGDRRGVRRVPPRRRARARWSCSASTPTSWSPAR